MPDWTETYEAPNSLWTPSTTSVVETVLQSVQYERSVSGVDYVLSGFAKTNNGSHQTNRQFLDFSYSAVSGPETGLVRITFWEPYYDTLYRSVNQPPAKTYFEDEPIKFDFPSDGSDYFSIIRDCLWWILNRWYAVKAGGSMVIADVDGRFWSFAMTVTLQYLIWDVPLVSGWVLDSSPPWEISFSKAYNPQARVYLSVVGSIAVRSEAETDILTVISTRQEALSGQALTFDYVKTPQESIVAANLDSRADTGHPVALSLDARANVTAGIPAEFDYLKTIIYAGLPVELNARAGQSALVPAAYDAIKDPLYAGLAAAFDSRGEALASFPMVLDTFALVRAMLAAGFDARAGALADVLAAFAGRQSMSSPAVPSAHHAMVVPGWHVVARNAVTGVHVTLGFVNQSDDPPVLTDVSLPDGQWTLEARPSEFFWQGCLTRQVTPVIIIGGEVFASGLPFVEDLVADVSSGLTRITWRIAGTYDLGTFEFGLWYSETSPVDTSGEPDDTFPYFVGESAYLTTRQQTVTEYVAVAAFTDLAQGPVAELELPWDTTPPASPPDQYAYRQ